MDVSPLPTWLKSHGFVIPETSISRQKGGPRWAALRILMPNEAFAASGSPHLMQGLRSWLPWRKAAGNDNPDGFPRKVSRLLLPHFSLLR